MQRVLLKLLIASVVVAAGIGMWIVLMGELGEWTLRVLLTGMCVAGGSLPAMACGAALDRGRVVALARAGVASSVGGFGMLLVASWCDGLGWPYFRLALTLIAIAVALAHVSVLSLASLLPRHRWAFTAAAAAALALAALVLHALWADRWDTVWYWQALSVAAIATSALSVLVAALHRMARAARVRPRGVVAHCPGCGHPAQAQRGRVDCPSCGARFDVAPVD